MPMANKNPSKAPVPGYHPITRWLHAMLVLGVIFQLACAALMAHPDHVDQKAMAVKTQPPVHKNDKLGDVFMGAHRTGGILVAFVALANLLWAVVARGHPRKRQIAVLFAAQHWKKAVSIAKSLPLIISDKKNLPEPGNALSRVFEMLGILVMSAMAMTGTVIWNLWAGLGYNVSPQAEWVMEIHASVAVFLLLYLAGHISMALIHARAGDPVFARILPLEKSRWLK